MQPGRAEAATEGRDRGNFWGAGEGAGVNARALAGCLHPESEPRGGLAGAALRSTGRLTSRLIRVLAIGPALSFRPNPNRLTRQHGTDTVQLDADQEQHHDDKGAREGLKPRIPMGGVVCYGNYPAEC